MTDMDKLLARISGLQRTDVERWIVLELVLPERTTTGYAFLEVDVARIRLIRDLCSDMDVNEAALPIVLSLLDQLTICVDASTSLDVRSTNTRRRICDGRWPGS